MSEEDIRDRLSKLIAVYDGLVKSQERRVREAVERERERIVRMVQARIRHKGTKDDPLDERDVVLDVLLCDIREGK